MKKNDIEKSLKNSLAEEKEAVWERVNSIVAFDEPAKEYATVSGTKVQSNGRKRGIFLSIVASFLIVAIALCFLFIKNPGKSGFIYIDINPSVQISVKSGKVDKLLALNDDAFVLLSGIDESEYKNKSPEDVAILVWESAYEKGYISAIKENNALLVSGAFGDEEFDKEINDKIKNKINKRIKDSGVYCAVLTEVQDATNDSEASKYGITVSKYQLIKRAIDIGVEIEESEFKSISIAEINERIENKVDEKWKDLTEEAKNEFHQKGERLKEKAQDIINNHVKPDNFDEMFEIWLFEKEKDFKEGWQNKKDEWKQEFDEFWGERR